MILRRYLWRELAVAAVAALGVTLIVFATHRLERLLDVAADGRLPGTLLLELTLVALGSRIDVLLPMATFAATLIALARLRGDGELDAMHAHGFGTGATLRALAPPALVVAALTAACSFHFAPQLRGELERMMNAGRAEALVGALAPGRFASFRGSIAGGGVIMASHIDAATGELSDVFVHVGGERRDGAGGDTDEQVLRGASAVLSFDPSGHRPQGEGSGTHLGAGAAPFLVLRDGRRYSGTPGAADFTVTRFASHAVRLDLLASPLRGLEPEAADTAVLLSGASGLPRPVEVGLLQWRLSLPLAALLLMALSVQLATLAPRHMRYLSVVAGVLVFVVYYNLLSVAQKLVERGDLPPWPGVLWVHVPALLLVLTPWLARRLRPAPPVRVAA